jgi:uncharacterized protein YkwD
VNGKHSTTPRRHAISIAGGFFKKLAIIFLAVILCDATLAISLRSQENSAPPSEDRASRLELQMWDLINADRIAPSSAEETKGRARPLQWDARLAAAARAHSEDMAGNGFFSHQGSDGSNPAVRVSRAGVQWRSTGENIAMVGDVVQGERLFMSEPKFQQNHRGNILNTSYTHVGVGIARGPDGSLYITQDFAELR